MESFLEPMYKFQLDLKACYQHAFLNIQIEFCAASRTLVCHYFDSLLSVKRLDPFGDTSTLTSCAICSAVVSVLGQQYQLLSLLRLYKFY
jgi:hypothetical protein